jgi:predicted nucleic acid-binding protein
MTSPPSVMVYSLDASALVKRDTPETGSRWLTAWCQPAPGTLIAIARLTKAEAAAACANKLRQGGLSQAHSTQALQDLAHDCAHHYLIVEMDQTLVDLAVDLTQRHKLRGYDAVHLAAALALHGLLTQAAVVPLRFVAADDDLLEATQSEGLATDHPNQHP